MPTYFAHVHTSTGTVPDIEGFEAATLADACSDMIVSIRALLVPDLQAGELDLGGSIDICDEHDSVLCTVNYKDAVRVTGA